MPIDLQNRVCIVTGAAQGLGAGVALGFARRGATVIATDAKLPTHEEVALNLEWDVTNRERATEVVEEVLAKYGRIDAFVANAGIYPRQEWSDISDADWHKVLGVNLDGTWHGCQAVAKPMTAQGYGKVVTVSSIEFNLGIGVHAHYMSAKGAIIGLTRSLARALGPSGVRVNCVMPGAVVTPTEFDIFPDRDATNKFCDERQCIPGRLTPETVEPSFAFLCSEESDAITGQVLCVDAGMTHY